MRGLLASLLDRLPQRTAGERSDPPDASGTPPRGTARHICLAIDQAMQRVGEELASVQPELSDDLRLINLEMRAGKARAEALHNLALRTGVDDLSSLVAVLVQTDKFGTSVAQSLRIHSEVLRTKRRQRAEEAAAKTAVKMVFPLVTCIFPAVWIVTIGPAAIKFIQILGPMAEP